MKLVVDASVLLKAYFPDEEGHNEAQRLLDFYSRGEIDLFAPYLLSYEIINACLIASTPPNQLSSK